MDLVVSRRFETNIHHIATIAITFFGAFNASINMKVERSPLNLANMFERSSLTRMAPAFVAVIGYNI